MGFGPNWKGVGLQHTRGLLGPSVNRWSIKRSPNDTKLDRRSTGSKPRPHDKSRSNPKTFNTCTRKEVEKDTGWHRSAELQNGQRGKCSDAWDEHVCKINAHDDMICNAWHASNDKATTVNNWKTPGTSVSGRYNTPPLREDLVPRSRMAPERNGRGRGKTKLLLRQTSETMNLERLSKMKERKQQRWTRLQTIR